MSKYYKIKEKQKVEFNDKVLEILEMNIQIKNKNESGGILIGSYIKETNNIIIDYTTEPNSNDIQKKYYFHRSNRYHQKFLNRLWKKNNVLGYLGDWHTHPEDYPTPSLQDKKNWKKLSKKAKYHGEYLFFVIVGRKLTKIWMIENKNYKITELKEII